MKRKILGWTDKWTRTDAPTDKEEDEEETKKLFSPVSGFAKFPFVQTGGSLQKILRRNNLRVPLAHLIGEGGRATYTSIHI